MLRFILSALLALATLSPANAVVSTTSVGDAAYTILATDTIIKTTTAFTAPRTWTLPNAAASCIGQTCPANSLQIFDTAGVITGTNTLTIVPASGETINGNAANIILSAAGVQVILVPTSGSNWQIIIQGDSVVSTLAAGSAVALTTATAKDVLTISLSQGTWLCTGQTSRVLNASTSVTVLSGSIGTVTNTLVAQGTLASNYIQTSANVIGALGQDTLIGPILLTPTATTTYRLVAQDTFTVSTDSAYGQVGCQRVK